MVFVRSVHIVAVFVDSVDGVVLAVGINLWILIVAISVFDGVRIAIRVWLDVMGLERTITAKEEE